MKLIVMGVTTIQAKEDKKIRQEKTGYLMVVVKVQIVTNKNVYVF